MFVDERNVSGFYFLNLIFFKAGMIPGILFIRQSEWVICIKKESYIQTNPEINVNPVNILHLKAQILYRVREKSMNFET